ncbi:MAG: UDP-N-acetylmuramoyl-L-alanine--D-glutamate ligase, partial [Candidatus Scalindua sp.]
MIQIEERKNTFKNKNVLVVGLARSGTGVANLLSSFGAKVSITDTKSRSSLEADIKKLLPSIKVITDGNPEGAFDTADLIVVSPGVPLSIMPLVHARTKGIPVIGELELAYQVIQNIEHRAQNTEHRQKRNKTLNSELLTHNSKLLTPHFIGVTGTNGKSTTTTLIDLMLKKSGFRTLLGGNIGNALTEEIYSRFTAIDYIVAEISSFQLESIKEFRPGIAAILNITPDHLDRYNTMEEYINAKARIFENQGSGDYLILNADDPVIMKIVNEKLEMKNKKSPKILFFSRKKEVQGIYCRNGIVYYNLPHFSLPASHLPLITVDEIKIKGVHNLENAMAASTIAFISGCSWQDIRDVLKDFPGLEHRLEFAGEVNGVRFINDSKGTNVGAVIKSLKSFKNVILIMGGMDKKSDFSVLQDLIRKKV